MEIQPFLERRQRLLASCEGAVAILPNAPTRYRNGGTEYPYRFDSDFWYLSAFPEPESVLVLDGRDAPSGGRSILFCRKKDEQRETWEGFRYGPEAARERFGFDEAHPIEDFEPFFSELIGRSQKIAFPVGRDRDWDAKLFQAIQSAKGAARKAIHPPEAILDLCAWTHAMRRIKDAHEIATMRAAAAIADEIGRASCRERV